MHMTEARHWREQRALKSLEEGKVSFLKAAQMAGLSVWELADHVREKGMVWIRSEKFIKGDIHELRRQKAAGNRKKREISFFQKR